MERAGLSKRIQREVRRQDRIYKSACAHRILEEFKDLRNLDKLHRFPVRDDCEEKCPEESFAIALESIYDSDEISESPRRYISSIVEKSEFV